VAGSRGIRSSCGVCSDSVGSPGSLPQLCTIDEVACYLGVSEYTVRRRLKSGELPGRKCGARWLVRVVDLAEYVEPPSARRLRSTTA
jgi:excisionase family DNA binding protein